MRFARLGAVGRETPVLVDGEVNYDLSGITRDIDGEFFESDGPARAAAAVAAGELPVFEADGIRVGAAIARPSAVICVGMNYAAHAAESGSAPPENLVMFLKTPNTVAGPFDTVSIPRGSSKTDWEVELGIVIGARASYLDSPEDSIRHIAGFVVANDLSERDFQMAVSGGQWSKGKCSPGFNPTGPVVVTPETDQLTLLTASLHNHGVTSTAREGAVRLSPHVTTDEETFAMLRGAFTSFGSAINL